MTLSTLDQIRLEIGDRDIDSPLFSDDELDYFISQVNDNVLLAAAKACDALAVRFAAGIDFNTDTMAVKKLQRSDVMAKRADELRERATGITPVEQVKVDGYSQDLDNDSTNTLPLNIDPDIPRYGPSWESDLERQQGGNYVPPD